MSAPISTPGRSSAAARRPSQDVSCGAPFGRCRSVPGSRLIALRSSSNFGLKKTPSLLFTPSPSSPRRTFAPPCFSLFSPVSRSTCSTSIRLSLAEGGPATRRTAARLRKQKPEPFLRNSSSLDRRGRAHFVTWTSRPSSGQRTGAEGRVDACVYNLWIVRGGVGRRSRAMDSG